MKHRQPFSPTCLLLIPIMFLLTVGQIAVAEEPAVVTIEGMKVRGDQEMPTVMYLVPWQAPVADSLEAVDERLMVEPRERALDRYEFQRLVRYHKVFQNRSQATGQARNRD